VGVSVFRCSDVQVFRYWVFGNGFGFPWNARTHAIGMGLFYPFCKRETRFGSALQVIAKGSLAQRKRGRLDFDFLEKIAKRLAFSLDNVSLLC
jgi:hypothetical protein